MPIETKNSTHGEKLPKDPFGKQTLSYIIENLGTDPLENLQLITRKLAKLAQNCGIIIEEIGILTVIAANRTNLKLPATDRIFDEAHAQKKWIIHTDQQYVPSDADIALCFPIIQQPQSDIKMPVDQRTMGEPVTKGFLYIYGDASLHDQLSALQKECVEVAPLININIEMHRLQQLASIDKLTGALNRKYLEIRTDRFVERAKKAKGCFSLIMLDIDFFKPINDTYGHLVGDEVLRAVSQVIKSGLEKDEILGRYGGEEFIVLLDNTSGNTAKQRAEQLRKAIQDAKILGQKRDVTVSMGIACFPEHGLAKKMLIEKADKAMYIAKKAGRNQSVLWDHTLSQPVRVKKRITEFITENNIQNAAHMMVLFELLSLQTVPAERRDTLGIALKKIMETTKAAFGAIYLIGQAGITEVVQAGHGIYNDRIIQEVMQTQTEVCKVDWENESVDIHSEDWQSIVVVPIIKKEVFQAILYIGVSIKEKEFSDSEIGFIHHAGNVMSAVL